MADLALSTESLVFIGTEAAGSGKRNGGEMERGVVGGRGAGAWERRDLIRSSSASDSSGFPPAQTAGTSPAWLPAH